MGNIFSSSDHHLQQAAAAAAERQRQRQREREREREAAQERHRQEQEQERQRQRQRQEQERERERLLQQAKAQAALRLRLRPGGCSQFTPSFYDKYDDSYADRDWEWHFDRAQANNNNDDDDDDDHNDARDDQGYTGSDGYYRIPQQQHQHNQHHLYHRQTQDDNEYAWRGLKKTDKAYTPPHSGKGRRKRCRKGKKGDLYENDYHAGYSKPEILAMSSERKAAFEAQKLRRQQRENAVSA